MVTLHKAEIFYVSWLYKFPFVKSRTWTQVYKLDSIVKEIKHLHKYQMIAILASFYFAKFYVDDTSRPNS